MGFGFTRWTEWEEKCSSTMPRRFSVCGHDHVNDHLWLQWQRCSSFIITIAGERQKGEKRREMTGGLTMEFVIVLSVLSGWTCMCVCVWIVCFMMSNEAEKRLVYDIRYQLESVYPRRSKWYFLWGLATKKNDQERCSGREEEEEKRMRPDV